MSVPSVTERVNRIIGHQFTLDTRGVVVLTQLVMIKAPVIEEIEATALKLRDLENEMQRNRDERLLLQNQLQDQLDSVLTDPERYLPEGG